jgi:hypothetical protein
LPFFSKIFILNVPQNNINFEILTFIIKFRGKIKTLVCAF